VCNGQPPHLLRQADSGRRRIEPRTCGLAPQRSGQRPVSEARRRGRWPRAQLRRHGAPSGPLAQGPAAAPRRAVGGGRHAHDRLVQPGGALRAVEAGVAVAEHAPVGVGHPVALTGASGRSPHGRDGAGRRATDDRLVDARHRPILVDEPVAGGHGLDVGSQPRRHGRLEDPSAGLQGHGVRRGGDGGHADRRAAREASGLGVGVGRREEGVTLAETTRTVASGGLSLAP